MRRSTPPRLGSRLEATRPTARLGLVSGRDHYRHRTTRGERGAFEQHRAAIGHLPLERGRDGLSHGQRFTGQARGVHLQRLGVDDAAISRHHVARLQHDHVAANQVCRVDLGRVGPASNERAPTGGSRQLTDAPLGAKALHSADHGVEHDHAADHARVAERADRCRQPAPAASSGASGLNSSSVTFSASSANADRCSGARRRRRNASRRIKPSRDVPSFFSTPSASKRVPGRAIARRGQSAARKLHRTAHAVQHRQDRGRVHHRDHAARGHGQHAAGGHQSPQRGRAERDVHALFGDFDAPPRRSESKSEHRSGRLYR